MTNLRPLAYAAIIALCACGDDDASSDAVTNGTTCAELCPSVVACDNTTTEAECETLCEEQRAAFNATAWDVFTGCAMGSSCDGMVGCLQQAVDASSSAPVDQFIGAVCEWGAACSDGLLTADSCRELVAETSIADVNADESANTDADTDAEVLLENPWDMMRLLRSSTLSCISGCFSELSCDNLDFSIATVDCVDSCGLGGVFEEITAEEEREVDLSNAATE